MIYILSQERERTTDIVLSYIRNKGADVTRINGESIISNLNLEMTDSGNVFTFEFGDKTISITESDIVWYRRGHLKCSLPIDENHTNEKIDKQLKEEWEYLRNYFHTNFCTLGSYIKERTNNRLANMSMASKVGLKIPPSIIATRKQDVQAFMPNDILITKPIHNGHISFYDDYGSWYKSVGLVVLKPEERESLPSRFAPSLFQQYIEKEFEIRTFFVADELYSMAIFSQNDSQTKYDYRNYNNTKPNRNVPYKLPKAIEAKVRNFMKEVDLNTGSIDLIKAKSGEFIFLEVNPTGQFGWVSGECNYYLEDIIAEHLITLHNEKN